jgi:hypothetical protein
MDAGRHVTASHGGVMVFVEADFSEPDVLATSRAWRISRALSSERFPSARPDALRQAVPASKLWAWHTVLGCTYGEGELVW